MSMGEIWGATDPVRSLTSKLVTSKDPAARIYDSVLYIHSLLASCQEVIEKELGPEEQHLAFKLIGVLPTGDKAKQAILRLDMDFFNRRPVISSKAVAIAQHLHEIGVDGWIDYARRSIMRYEFLTNMEWFSNEPEPE